MDGTTPPERPSATTFKKPKGRAIQNKRPKLSSTRDDDDSDENDGNKVNTVQRKRHTKRASAKKISSKISWDTDSE